MIFYGPPDPDTALTFDEVEAAGLDGTLRTLTPGLDYEQSCCPICGGTTPPAEHDACMNQLGTWEPVWWQDQ